MAGNVDETAGAAGVAGDGGEAAGLAGVVGVADVGDVLTGDGDGGLVRGQRAATDLECGAQNCHASPNCVDPATWAGSVMPARGAVNDRLLRGLRHLGEDAAEVPLQVVCHNGGEPVFPLQLACDFAQSQPAGPQSGRRRFRQVVRDLRQLRRLEVRTPQTLRQARKKCRPLLVGLEHGLQQLRLPRRAARERVRVGRPHRRQLLTRQVRELGEGGVQVAQVPHHFPQGIRVQGLGFGVQGLRFSRVTASRLNPEASTLNPCRCDRLRSGIRRLHTSPSRSCQRAAVSPLSAES